MHIPPRQHREKFMRGVADSATLTSMNVGRNNGATARADVRTVSDTDTGAGTEALAGEGSARRGELHPWG